MFDLLVIASLVVCVCGTILLCFKVLKLKTPKWLLPLAAGCSVLSYAIWAEYTWAERTIGGLPKGYEVVMRVETSSFFRPWTQFFPFVDQIIIINTEKVVKNPDNESGLVVMAARMERYLEPEPGEILVGCTDKTAAMTRFNDEGKAEGIAPLNDTLASVIVAKVCK